MSAPLSGLENKSDFDLVTDTDKKSEALVIGTSSLHLLSCLCRRSSHARGWLAALMRYSEICCQGHLKKRFPSHKFIGEESAADDVQLTDEPTWMIDPLDGTTNL